MGNPDDVRTVHYSTRLRCLTLKHALETYLKALPTHLVNLTFAITKLLDGYLIQNDLSYTNINDCLGALEGAKLEFYRRIVVPYEAKKMSENGDVYSEENLTYR